MRLVGGFGTPCDPLYTGIVEIFHAGEWGVICGGRLDPTDSPFGTLAPDVICRQLGFPHGTVVDGLEPGNTDNVEESQLPLGRIWLRDLLCRGPEERVLDCDLVPRRFLRRRDEASFGSCGFSERRLNVACRQFAVEPALEAVTTPDAGAQPPVQPSSTTQIVRSLIESPPIDPTRRRATELVWVS